MSARLEAKVVYGVPISYDQRESLEEKFGYDVDRYTHASDYDYENFVFGFCIANGVEDRAIEVPADLSQKISITEQIKASEMLKSILDKQPEWKTYLLFYQC